MAKNTLDAFAAPADPELTALVTDALGAYRAWHKSEEELDAQLRFKASLREGAIDLTTWLRERTATESR